MDTAPYAVSVGRYFFGSRPEKISCVVSERQQDGLDIEYSLMMSYPDGKTMIGHFGFNTEYINQVHLMGHRTNVLCNRGSSLAWPCLQYHNYITRYLALD